MDIMTVNGVEYTVLQLLGKGKGGYSYLATDGKNKYTLKQIHHEPCSYYQFGDKIQAEINDYKRLKNFGIAMPEMIDVDVENERILKEYIEGETIFDLVLQDKMKDEYIEQVKAMCALLYPQNTNIDYECNDYMEEWNFENWGVKYWYKTPEFLEYVSKNKSYS